jgi:hypothetical protein
MIPTRQVLATVALATLAGLSTGCARNHGAGMAILDPPQPLGALIDPVWQAQETNAEASDFVIHDHEFLGNSSEMNEAGLDHLEQIAARAAKDPFPILVEPNSMTAREGDEYGFAVHNDPELDLERREVVVALLETLGVPEAGERVVVSPALTPGFQSIEAENAYQRGFSGQGFGAFGGFGGAFNPGFGGGFGGFGGGGGVGGFGGFGGGF